MVPPPTGENKDLKTGIRKEGNKEKEDDKKGITYRYNLGSPSSLSKSLVHFNTSKFMHKTK
jgi:hypothetical protein